MKKKKTVIIIGYSTIAKLINGQDVKLKGVMLIPDDQLFNEHKKITLEKRLDKIIKEK